MTPSRGLVGKAGIRGPMPRSKTSLEPQQERSRESLRKLLKAAAEVLGQHGVDGTTIPRIAQHAGLTPGAVYRRIRGKEKPFEKGVLGRPPRKEKRRKGGVSPPPAAPRPP